MGGGEEEGGEAETQAASRSKGAETMESKWVLTTVIRQDSTRRFL